MTYLRPVPTDAIVARAADAGQDLDLTAIRFDFILDEAIAICFGDQVPAVVPYAVAPFNQSSAERDSMANRAAHGHRRVHGVEAITFADGTEWTRDDLLNAPIVDDSLVYV